MTPRPEELYAKYAGYMLYQLEKCPSTGRLHYQGYIQLGLTPSGNPRKVRFTVLHALNPYKYGLRNADGSYTPCERETPNRLAISGTWFRRARGSSDKNYVYCTKEESRVAGTVPFQMGTLRTNKGVARGFDPDQARLQMVNGTFDPFASPQSTWFYAQNEQRAETLSSLRLLKKAKECDFAKTRVWFLYGSFGCGKTHAAKYGIFDDDGKFTHEYMPEHLDGDGDSTLFWEPHQFSDAGAPWFGDYKGQNRIVIDEWEKTSMYRKGRLEVLIQVCGQTGGWFPAKHSTRGVPRCWTEIVITSNLPPDEVFRDPIYDCLKRRLRGNVIEFAQPVSAKIATTNDMSWEQIKAERQIAKVRISGEEPKVSSPAPRVASTRLTLRQRAGERLVTSTTKPLSPQGE